MNPVTTRLKEARRLIEAGWCQKGYAKDAGGFYVYINHSGVASGLSNEASNPEPVSYCLIGAIRRAAKVVSPTDEFDTAYKATRYVRDCVGSAFNGLLDDWNDVDGRTQAEVLEVLDCAIVKSGEPPA